jgi:hypothetical protein
VSWCLSVGVVALTKVTDQGRTSHQIRAKNLLTENGGIGITDHGCGMPTFAALAAATLSIRASIL